MALDESNVKPPLDIWAQKSVLDFRTMRDKGLLIGAQSLRAVIMAEGESYVADGHSLAAVNNALERAYISQGTADVEKYLRG